MEGYRNNWDFSNNLIEKYLIDIKAAGVGIVELVFRLLNNECFKGACAFTADNFLKTLIVLESRTVSIAINRTDLCSEIG